MSEENQLDLFTEDSSCSGNLNQPNLKESRKDPEILCRSPTLNHQNEENRISIITKERSTRLREMSRALSKKSNQLPGINQESS
jgi:hypothetical protein